MTRWSVDLVHAGAFAACLLEKVDTVMQPRTLARLSDEKINWVGSIPFFVVHAVCLSAFWIGAPLSHLLACIGLYYVRMFGITAVYHRYFAHRAYKTSRVFQFLLALLATTSAQKGVLWWAAHHRHHHRHQ